jgi:MoaA/NifB/PqqE/SkfB family radical SAM enzyme
MSRDTPSAPGFSGARRRALARSQPLFVLIELTYRCNWRCLICYNSKDDRGRELSADEWRRVAGELREIGALVVTLTGGEPLSHPEFFSVARGIRRESLALVLFTNGSLVDERAADAIAALDPLRIAMSLHGARAATHDAMTRVPGSFDAMLSGLRRLQARGVRTTLRTPLSCVNEAEIDSMTALAAELGTSYRIDPRLTPRDDGCREPLCYGPSDAGIARLFGRLAAGGQVPRVSLEPGGVNCGAGRLTLSIGPGGDVFPCLSWKSLTPGNVRDRPLREIWRESPALDHVRSITRLANETLRRAGSPVADFPFCPAHAETTEGDPLAIGREQRALALAAEAAVASHE